MSDRSRRKQIDFDYKIFHKTGEKVVKNREFDNMDLEEKKVRELQICEDIDEIFNLYVLSEMDTTEELSECLEQICDVSRQYRHIHVELKSIMGEEAYNTAYENKKIMSEKMRNFIRDSKVKFKKMKIDDKMNEEGKLQQAKVNDETKIKTSLKIEEEVFRDKLEREFKIFELIEKTEIEKQCFKFESLLDEYYKLFSRVKIVYGDEYIKDFEGIFDVTINQISEKIQVGKLKVRELNAIQVQGLAAEKERHECELHDNFIDEQKFHAKTISKEIETRSKELCKKCDISELETMSDYQVLECQKNMSAIDCEMREIFDKVTAYSKIAALCGSEKDQMLIRPYNLQEKALNARNLYAMKLHSIFSERDISEEKLKNASGLTIDLAKFKGYESKLDIYTFKNEFEKLIQPTYQKRYWVDVLKKNYLCGPALVLVEKNEKIEELWDKLINAYGNVKLLLQNKISNLDKLSNLEKVKGDEKLGNAIARIINMMTELSTLASKHNLEYKLYIGGGLEKIYSLIGEERERKFLSKNINQRREIKTGDLERKSEVFAEKLEWENLLKFLKNELTLREKLTLVQKSRDCLGMNSSEKTSDAKKSAPGKSVHIAAEQAYPCHICNKTDHVLSTDKSGKKHVDYFSCQVFVAMSPKDRKIELQKKKFCFQCLVPGMKYDERHKCYKKYVCPDSSHNKFPKGVHVLICEDHKMEKANIELLSEYKRNFISTRSENFRNFTKNIGLVCRSEQFVHATLNEGGNKLLPDISESAIFMLQTINVGGNDFNVFYDTGCGDVVVKKSAIDKLINMGRAKLEVPGPITLSGVGDQKSICDHGIFSICLPLRDGYDAILSGVCLDRVTTVFPKYALEEVEKDVRKCCKKRGGLSTLKTLPKLSSEVGGETDILIGVKYLKYHPQKIWESATGLSVSESCFLSSDGTIGVIAGPHPVFTETDRKHQSTQAGNVAYEPQSNLSKIMSCFTSAVYQYRNIFLSGRDISLLGAEKYGVTSSIEVMCGTTQESLVEVGDHSTNKVLVSRRPPKCVKVFDEVESAGTEITYRCVACRNCQECKKSLKIDGISIQEEIEQDLINRSVKVDIDRGLTIAKLPFVTDPDLRLVPNEKLALRIYESQIRSLANKLDDKIAVIKSEGKLQELGFVAFFDDLPKEDKELILSSIIKYFIPWRAVWNLNSLSTPCRLVLDASLCPRGGCSLNSLLAKGTNNMNNLIAILIRWTTHKYAFHTDITKMYNAVLLDKAHWRYQLYLWDEGLRLGVHPRWKVIKTLIYGVRPSGNLAECGIRKTAELTQSQCPKAHDIIMNDIYVDDCLSGEESIKERLETTDQLSIALSKGGFNLKGFTFSGKDPPEHLSNDGRSVTVGGLKWFPKEDTISINIPDLNFAKKTRGKKSQNQKGIIPEGLTRRDCCSKVGEVWDPIGRVTPLTSALKIDLNQLCLRKLDWDDKIPDDLRRIWLSNFEMIQEVGTVRFNRAIIPEDAIDTNINTICMGDASQVMVCVAIYARFRTKSGYSCQLVFARSKVVPQDMSMPRAELLAAAMNAATGHVVKTAFGHRHRESLFMTDSQVALHWIGCTKSKLKMWVRNKVIEINRLVDVSDWRFVESKNMIADLGTRKGAKVVDVGPDSEWINGMAWMRGEKSNFPMKTAAEIVLDSEAKHNARKEQIVIDVIDGCDNNTYMQHVPDVVGSRYKFSRYLIDPNRFRFRKVVRVMALVFLFIKKLLIKINKTPNDTIQNDLIDIPSMISYQQDKYIVTTGKTKTNNNKTGKAVECKGGLVVDLSKTMIKAAMQYYFKKGTDEVKRFLPESKYKDISVERNGVLYYIGRILPNQEVGGKLTLCDVSFDLCNATFCVPILDRMSPIAYAIADEVHWYHPDVKHGGIESLLRQVQCIAHIIEGRKLVKNLKSACIMCRLLAKRAVKVSMGPKHDSNLCIAPAFHSTQVDICGPFESFSNANKRAKIKVWIVVFCCCATGAVDCKVMEDYSTDAFILAFIRFSCRYGYPCSLLPDYGSQLIKGCKDMILSFADIKHKISVEFGVKFETCPVGAHYVHGKVERKIQQIKKSIEREIGNKRLSIIQWESLGQQIANSINNLPIGLGNKTESLENLDLLTPNRLLLGRNNNRSPTAPLVLIRDVKKIVDTNSDIFKVWFKSWLISYVPSLIEKPKWFQNDKHVSEGDIVLFSKSEKEFENQYQYGIITSAFVGRDGHIRTVEIEYQNYTENVKRCTKRGVRDIIIIHPIDELGINKELYDLANIDI